MISPENYIECESKWFGSRISDYNMMFKFIGGVDNTLADILSVLIELKEPNSSEKEGY